LSIHSESTLELRRLLRGGPVKARSCHFENVRWF
jgi:hypothetical protein